MLAVLAAGFGAVPAQAGPALVRQAVHFVVADPSQPGASLRVAGSIYRRRGRGCGSALLLVHGLSFGQSSWDFPIDSSRYSTAQALARAGYATVDVDLPGYGRSDKPNGYTLTIPAMADVVAQILTQLRTGSYGGARFAHVGLMGHSAGGEIAESVAATSPVDILVVAGFTHSPSSALGVDLITNEIPRSLMSDYEDFCGPAANRLACMYYGPGVDRRIELYENAHRNPTPSGELLSAPAGPSRVVMATITAPVLLVVADHDALFPPDGAAQELQLFVSAASATSYTARNAGHAFMLHRSAPQTNAAIASWLHKQHASFPACA